MKKEEDFELDYQTKSPITETPDPNAPRMPIFSMKKVVTGVALFFVCVFTYSFHSMQKEVLNEYKKNKSQPQETANWESHKQRMEEIRKFAEEQNNVLVKRLAEKYSDIFFGYLASLNYAEDNSFKKNYSPLVFQKAQKEFIDLSDRFKTLESEVNKNIESNEIEKSYSDYIQLNMPLWKYAFEKASNSKNVWLVAEEIQKLSSNDYVPNQEVCKLVKSEIPELKVNLKCD